MKPSNFSLARFSNRNGTVSWRVSGWIADVRIRKNFKSREEAAAEMAALNAKALQHASGLRLASTFLTDAHLRSPGRPARRGCALPPTTRVVVSASAGAPSPPRAARLARARLAPGLTPGASQPSPFARVFAHRQIRPQVSVTLAVHNDLPAFYEIRPAPA